MSKREGERKSRRSRGNFTHHMASSAAGKGRSWPKLCLQEGLMRMRVRKVRKKGNAQWADHVRKESASQRVVLLHVPAGRSERRPRLMLLLLLLLRRRRTRRAIVPARTAACRGRSAVKRAETGRSGGTKRAVWAAARTSLERVGLDRSPRWRAETGGDEGLRWRLRRDGRSGRGRGGSGGSVRGDDGVRRGVAARLARDRLGVFGLVQEMLEEAGGIASHGLR